MLDSPKTKVLAKQKAEELYRLVAKLIVEVVIRDFNAEPDVEDTQDRE